MVWRPPATLGEHGAHNVQTYIGTKIIQAEPQDKKVGESGIEYGYKVVYPDGYISWSPAIAFEQAYRLTSGMPFGLAIEALKKGLRVSRAGWNGKGMYLALVSGGVTNHPLVEAGADVEALPSIGMWTVNAHGRKAFLNGWLASQTDMLSDDWLIVGEVA